MLRHPLRVPLLLLVVYPLCQVAGAARYTVEYGAPLGYLSRFPLWLVFIAASVGLWRGRGWSYPLALALGFLTSAVLLLVVFDAMQAGEFSVWSSDDQVRTWLSIGAGAGATGLLLLPRVRSAFVGSSPLESLRRLVTGSLATECMLMGLVGVFGLGGFSPAWYQVALGATQAPGTLLLVLMGLCCGYSNPLVFSDTLDSHWGGLTRVGILVLMLANTVGLLFLALLARRALRGLGRRRAGTHSALIVGRCEDS